MGDFRTYLKEALKLNECKAKLKSLEKKLKKCGDDKVKCKKIKAEIKKCKKALNEWMGGSMIIGHAFADKKIKELEQELENCEDSERCEEIENKIKEWKEKSDTLRGKGNRPFTDEDREGMWSRDMKESYVKEMSKEKKAKKKKSLKESMTRHDDYENESLSEERDRLIEEMRKCTDPEQCKNFAVDIANMNQQIEKDGKINRNDLGYDE
jgi:selenocysteine-specific translation elongation factor